MSPYSVQIEVRSVLRFLDSLFYPLAFVWHKQPLMPVALGIPETSGALLASMMLTVSVVLWEWQTGRGTSVFCSRPQAASWMVGRHTPFPFPSTELTWRPRIWPSCPGMVMKISVASCSRRSQTDRSTVSPTWWTPDPAAADGSTSLSIRSFPHATELVCCEIQVGTSGPWWHSSGRKISGGES